MNRPHDPQATVARPDGTYEPSTSPLDGADSERTVDRADAGTHRSRTDRGLPGDLPVIPGHRVLREIARGGMGRVLAAVDLSLDREVAVKVLLPGATPDRFVRESQITARLPHPGIPPVYGMGTLADGSPYLAMKLVVGHTLAVERKTADRNRLLRHFTQVCQAVGYAHAHGVVHRDLKPGNVMVGAFGEVLVMDWGLAKSLTAGAEHHLLEVLSLPPDPDDPEQTVARAGAGESTEDQTRAGTVLGTPAYMAPEQARGEPATPAADVYGLGAILYALLVGRAPYTGANAAEVLHQVATSDPPLFARKDHSVPPALVAICRKSMARKPADRYRSPEELADDVNQWLAGEAVSAYREPWTDRVGRWARRRRAGVMTAAGVLVALTAAAVVTAVMLWDEKERTKGEWERAEREKIKAAGNEDAAVRLVHDLNGYMNTVELSGNRQSLTDQQRKAALDQALPGYERLLALRPDDVALRLSLAQTHRYRANLCRALNLTGEAEESFEKAIQLYRDLVASHPATPSYRIDLAITSRDYSLLMKSLGRLGRAAELLDTPIRLYEELRAANPKDEENLRRMAIALLDRAELDYQLGRLSETEQNARLSADLFEALASNPKAVVPPLDPLFHGMAEGRRAVALRELGRLEDALTIHDRCVQRFSKYLGLAGDNTRTYTFEYHWAQAERALTLERQTGREAEVLETLGAAIAGNEKLVSQFPSFPPYQRNWAACLLFRGRVRAKTGLRADAENDLTTAAAKLEGLAQQFQPVPVYRLYLGQTYAALAELESDANRKADYVRKARARLDEAAHLAPESALVRNARSELDAMVNGQNR